MSRTCLSLALCLTLLASSAGAAGTYTVIDLGNLGAPGSQAFGLNGSGLVVGASTTAAGQSHAFVYAAGRMSDLGLRGSQSVATAVNASGQIAGYYYSGSYQAFLSSGGRVKDVGTLGGSYSAAYGVNALGHVCGSSYTRKNREHAFLWTGKRMTDLGTLGGEYSSARGVNSSDQVVGYAYLANGVFRAFVTTGAGAMRDLGTLGGDFSVAYAINDDGQVVGQAYLPGNFGAHAALWRDGAVTDLGDLGAGVSEALALDSRATRIVGRANVRADDTQLVYHACLWSGSAIQDLNASIPSGSGWVLEEARGVDDAGRIVGYGDHDGQVSAFLLVPAGASAEAAGPAVARGTNGTAATAGVEAAGGLRALELSRVLPNPARASARLAYALPRPGPAELWIADVSGRVVRRTHLATQEAGEHAWTWDLHDGAGHPVGPGVYFVRLAQGEETRVARVSVLR